MRVGMPAMGTSTRSPMLMLIGSSFTRPGARRDSGLGSLNEFRCNAARCNRPGRAAPRPRSRAFARGRSFIRAASRARRAIFRLGMLFMRARRQSSSRLPICAFGARTAAGERQRDHSRQSARGLPRERGVAKAQPRIEPAISATGISAGRTYHGSRVCTAQAAANATTSQMSHSFSAGWR